MEGMMWKQILVYDRSSNENTKAHHLNKKY